MKNEQMKTTMNGALILTVAALVAKILSALYRIPFQNIVGNTGFYVYQQIYPLYGIGMTFALNGLPVFISKLVAQEDDEGDRKKLLAQVFLVLAVFSSLIFIGLQTGAVFIANAMGDLELRPLITSVSWMFLLMPFLAVARGYYQGTFNMFPTALSQVCEQLVRVSLIIGVAVLSSRLNWSVYRTGSFAMLGSVLGAIVAGGIFVKFWARFFSKRPFHEGLQGTAQTIKLLIQDGLIICLFSALMVLLQLVDSFSVMNSLRVFGLSSDKAKYIKGIYDRGQPLVQLGMTIAISFSSTLLPALTTALKQKNGQQYRKISLMMLHVGIALSVAAAVGLVILMPQINTLLFGDAKLSATLSVYVLSVPLISVISIYNSILQSTDNFLGTLLAVGTALIVKICLNSYLVRSYGIMGAALCTDLSLITAVVVLLLLGSAAVWQSSKEFIQYGMRLSICTGLMLFTVGMLSWVWNTAFSLTRINALLFTIVGILSGVIVFIGCAIKWRLLTPEEWETLPGGRKLCKLVGK